MKWTFAGYDRYRERKRERERIINGVSQDQDRKIQFSDRLGDPVLGIEPRPREIIETIYSTIRVKPVLISGQSRDDLFRGGFPFARHSLNLHNCFLMIWIISLYRRWKARGNASPEEERPPRSIIDYYGRARIPLRGNVTGENYYRRVFVITFVRRSTRHRAAIHHGNLNL